MSPLFVVLQEMSCQIEQTGFIIVSKNKFINSC